MVVEESLKVCELFYSIQGESSFAGYPTAFIRLSGCNLQCSYCDTKYALQETGKLYTVNSLLEFVEKYPGALVEITGGEPLLQAGVYQLMRHLLAAGKTVLLETNGSINLKKVPAEVIKIMDIKTPDSGMSERMESANFALLAPWDEIKFVLNSRRDYDWAVQIVKNNFSAPGALNQQGWTKFFPANPVHENASCVSRNFRGVFTENSCVKPKIIFSPVVKKLSARRLAEWLLADQLPIRLQVQLHTVIWPEKERGV